MRDDQVSPSREDGSISHEVNLPLTPRKSLGQHFLTDPSYCRRIVRMAGITETDRVIEIGPGTGALTSHLLKTAATLFAVEIDARSVEHLVHTFRAQLESGRLRLLQEDALNLDWGAFLDRLDLPVRTDRTESRAEPKLVANLPYNIATRLLIRTTRAANRFHSLTVMTQKEVARRILAPPGGKEYGFLSVLMAFHYQRKSGFDVPPGAFTPSPRVTSHVLQLIPAERSDLLGAASREDFLRMISGAFRHRRKTLLKNLQALGFSSERLQDVFRRLDLDQRVRAEQVSLEGFTSLTEMLSFAL